MNSTEASRKKIGLALSGGAARGLAYIGVLEVLQREGITIDMIAGTSAGAVAGAIYAYNQDVNRVKEDALGMNWMKIAPLLDISLFKSGLIKGRKIKNLIASYIGGSATKFSDLKIPFACVASNIETGEEVVIDSGSVADALRASISIPGIFTSVKYEGRQLVDGGLTTPVPVHVVRKMGADFIIAVNVTPDVNDRVHKIRKTSKEPGIFHVITQSIFITTYAMSQLNLRSADIVIEPDLENISAGDFQKAREAIKRGEQAARSIIPEIKRRLEKL